MAQSKSFFGLRKGSTKSLTFSALNGKQITKDRVSEVKNPKTTVQMSQRCCFATVTHAFAALKEICNHSFETASGKTMNQAEFVKRNVAMLREQEGNFGPKSWNYLIPNNYIVADGTLSLNAAISAYNADSVEVDAHFYPLSTVYGLDDIFSLSDSDFAKFTWQQFADTLGMEAGEQLTFMQIYSDKNEYLGAGNVYSSTLNLCRIVIPTSTEGLAKPMFQANGASTEIFKIINAGETSQNLDNFIVQKVDQAFGIRVPDSAGNAAKVYGAALIRSAYVNGKWKRSKATLQYSPTAIVLDDLTMEKVLPTWNPSSELYLDNAAKSNSANWQNSVTSGGSTSGGSTSGGSTSGGSEEEGDVIL